MSLLSRIANVFRGERLNREIEEEYASHLEEAILAGRDPVEARNALGNALRRREESHDIRVGRCIAHGDNRGGNHAGEKQFRSFHCTHSPKMRFDVEDITESDQCQPGQACGF